LTAGAVACLAFVSIVQPVFAQDVDPRCKDIFDKVACTCAVRNGGHVIPPPVGVKREGLKLRPKKEEAAGAGRRTSRFKVLQKEGQISP
jgi:hypothetical protein